jgi:hypothetical protein
MLAARAEAADLVSRMLAAAPAARRCCDPMAEPSLAPPAPGGPARIMWPDDAAASAAEEQDARP